MGKNTKNYNAIRKLAVCVIICALSIINVTTLNLLTEDVSISDLLVSKAWAAGKAKNGIKIRIAMPKTPPTKGMFANVKEEPKDVIVISDAEPEPEPEEDGCADYEVGSKEYECCKQGKNPVVAKGVEDKEMIVCCDEGQTEAIVVDGSDGAKGVCCKQGERVALAKGKGKSAAICCGNEKAAWDEFQNIPVCCGKGEVPVTVEGRGDDSTICCPEGAHAEGVVYAQCVEGAPVASGKLPCGTKTYDPSTHGCCKDFVYELKFEREGRIFNQGCCEDTGVIYLSDNDECCGSGSVTKGFCCDGKHCIQSCKENPPPPTADNFAENYYDVRTQSCCGGRPYDLKDDEGNEYGCCENSGETYIVGQTECCGDTVVIVGECCNNETCKQKCGEKIYDSRTQGCCGGQVYDLKDRYAEYGCCGDKEHGQTYVVGEQECCCNVSVAIGTVCPKICWQTCAGKNYRAINNVGHEQFCCTVNGNDAGVYDGKTQGCCISADHNTAAVYEQDSEKCCGGSVISKDKCCAPPSELAALGPDFVHDDSSYDFGCCGDKVNPDKKPCCGGKFYDDTEKKCCDNKTVAKDFCCESLGEKCCGNKILKDGEECCDGKVYHDSIEGCCAGEIYNLKNLDGELMYCCQKIVTKLVVNGITVGTELDLKDVGVYNRERQICCNGSISSRYDKHGNAKICCGGGNGKLVSSEVCCPSNGEVDPDLQECCSFHLDTLQKKCCGGNLIDKDSCCRKGSSASEIDAFCCGGKTLNEGYDCCDGKSYFTGSARACCAKPDSSGENKGGKVYDTHYDQCCNGKVISKSSKCCDRSKGDECDSDSQCGGFAVCNSDCKCEVTGECAHDSDCGANMWCHSDEGPNGEHYCDCNDYFVPAPDGKSCVCKRQQECEEKGEKLNEKTCECVEEEDDSGDDPEH